MRLKSVLRDRSYWLIALLLAVNVFYFVYGYFARQDLGIVVIDTDRIVEALRSDEIESVVFHEETSTIDGTFKAPFAGKYGHRRFTYTGQLGSGIYEQIIDKNLSASPSLGAAAGLDKNPEFEKAAQIEDVAGDGAALAGSPFRSGEKAVYALEFLGIEAGELAFEARGVKRVKGEAALEYVIKAKSRPGFKVYTLNDTATVFLSLKDFRPLAASVIFEEKNRYGSLYQLFDYPGSKISEWQNYVESRRGRLKAQDEIRMRENHESPFGVIFQLRRQRLKVGESKELVIQDHERTTIIRVKPVRRETLAMAAGDKASIVTEIEIEFDDPNKKNDGAKATVWLSDDSRQFILKIEVALKLGTISAQLKALEPR